MSIRKTISMLHPFERAILPLISSSKNFLTLLDKTDLKEVAVMRALEWLENKKIIKTKKTTEKFISLGKNGKIYAKEGLPERRVINLIKKTPSTFSHLRISAGLNKEELNAAIGILRRLQAISIDREKGLIIKITDKGEEYIKTAFPEEEFLKQRFPFSSDKLDAQKKRLVDQLDKRQEIIIIKDEKDRLIELTALGEEILQHDLSKKELIGRVTPSILQSSEWKKNQFRPYDVTINVPSVYPGKRHIVTQAVQYIRRIWLELGFKEMNGRMIETAFWDLDSLFVPQDHPARDMQDTFYVAQPAKGALPPLAKTIKAVHENGGKTGSTGWGYSWSAAEAEKLLLRTHTTVLSAQTLAKLKLSDLPAKFFAVGKVFRNESLDWKHLFEFYQVEGIVVDPDANMRHLKGYLREFYKKMGYNKVRIRPAHFPYTEPSCEVEVYHPIRKEWIELGGAGIFRPELVVPLLGRDVPVLAWGQGMGRIISSYYDITDIRDLYKNDLKMLREAKLWVR